MWEFFFGVSLACFFAAYWIKRESSPKPRPREAVYAPRDEVLHYKTRKKEDEYVTAAPYPFEETKPAARAATPMYNATPTYRAPAARPFEPAKNDEFVEYAASVVTEENTGSAPNNAGNSGFEENAAKNDSEAAQIDEDDEKKQKFSALRFFNS